MTLSEIESAKRLLWKLAERFYCVYFQESRTWALSAHWYGGGKMVFHSLDAVLDYIALRPGVLEAVVDGVLADISTPTLRLLGVDHGKDGAA